MADDLMERYGDLLTGSYDCVDRVVLNAYFSIGHNPGGFRSWWRRLHGGSDDELDDAHLMRMAGRFARRVKAWAAANGMPMIFCTAGQRKHLIAEQYLEQNPVSPGVFLVLAAKARATVWKVHRDVARVGFVAGVAMWGVGRLRPGPVVAAAAAGATPLREGQEKARLATYGDCREAGLPQREDQRGLRPAGNSGPS